MVDSWQICMFEYDYMTITFHKMTQACLNSPLSYNGQPWTPLLDTSSWQLALRL